ncbi:MAG: CHASE2 domain-containing protein [Bacteroidaceae bacterium]|nr:CHASE2 domain-containing protein [Bacteroidaceae bacterium]
MRQKGIFRKILRVFFRPREMAILAVAFLIIGMLRYVTFHVDVFNPVAQGLKGFSTTDVFYDMMLASPADTSNIIVIVDITRLHDRDSIATVLEEVDALEPAAIDIDVVFEYPKEPNGDMHLVNVAATLSNAVFSFKMMDPDPEKNEFTRQVHSFFAEELGITEGFVNVDRRMTRDIPLCLEMNGKSYPSVIARMMEVIQGKPFDYKSLRKHPINYEPTVFRVIPYDSVQHYAPYITGHVVMFGGAYESVDVLYTPLGQKYGIEVLCYALKTILEMKQQIDCKGWLFWLLTILFSYIGVCIIMAYKDKALSMPADGLLGDIMRTIFITSFFIFFVMMVYMAVGFILFQTWRINFDLTPTLAAMAFTTTAADIVRITIKHTNKKLYKMMYPA